jgi:hypothetical protein
MVCVDNLNVLVVFMKCMTNPQHSKWLNRNLKNLDHFLVNARINSFIYGQMDTDSPVMA